MKLLHDPEHPHEEGDLRPVPPNLKRLLLPWANTTYREYIFGYMLTQDFSAKKFSIQLWWIHAKERDKLYPVSERSIIVFQCLVEGNIQFSLFGFGEKTLQKSSCQLLYIPSGINEISFEPGIFELLQVELEPAFLEDIADTHREARDLLERLNQASDQGLPMVSVSLNYKSKAIIKQIRDYSKAGGDLVIDMHRYIIDLLTEYITGISDRERDQQKKNIPHKETLIKIKEEIMTEPHIHRQKINNLAVKFGISITELEKNFKALFGMSPGAFVRFHSLSKGSYLITTTNRTIDDISEEVGYNYRINFDISFKRQFGYLPTRLRKR